MASSDILQTAGQALTCGTSSRNAGIQTTPNLIPLIF